MSEHVFMVNVLKYAVVERERRFVVAGIPEGVTQTLRIEDYYIEHTRLRLRRVTAADGSLTRKPGHKVRLGQGASAIACTSLYLDEQEWDVLVTLPHRTLAQDPSHRREGWCRPRPDGWAWPGAQTERTHRGVRTERPPLRGKRLPIGRPGVLSCEIRS